MSDTPLTDALLLERRHIDPTETGECWNADDVMAFLKHSRKLERENAAYQHAKELVHKRFYFQPHPDDPKKCNCAYCAREFEPMAEYAALMEMETAKLQGEVHNWKFEAENQQRLKLELAKTNSELKELAEGFEFNYNELMKAHPWTESNDMEYADEFNCGLNGLIQERDALREHLRIILPMAKGFAHEHQVGNNQKMCNEAQVAISQPDKS